MRLITMTRLPCGSGQHETMGGVWGRGPASGSTAGSREVGLLADGLRCSLVKELVAGPSMQPTRAEARREEALRRRRLGTHNWRSRWWVLI